MTNVSLYDAFYRSDAYVSWNITFLLATDSYTFNASHTLDDITPYEVTGDGYARTSSVITNDGTGTDDVSTYTLGDYALFTAMTVSYRYVVILDGFNVPIGLVDAGSTQSLSDEELSFSGPFFTIAASG